MNLVVVCDSGTLTGGAPKVAITTAIALKPHMDRIAYFAGMGHDEVLERAGIETVDVEQNWFFNHSTRRENLRFLISNPVAKARFAELLKDFSPRDTIVHIHLCVDRLSTSVIDVAATLGFKVVFTCHDYAITCPTGLQYDFRSESICHRSPLSLECCTRNCTRFGYMAKATRVVRSYVPNVLHGIHRKVARFIFVSDFSRRILEPHLRAARPGSTLHNPIDLFEAPAVDVAANDAFIWIGRMTLEKDPVLLARAAKLADVPVVFGGDGPQADAVRVENPRAEITGWLRSDDIYTRIRKSRAAVMTSRWYEAAPLVTPEALAAGLPVVVPDTCAARDFIIDGETGIIFKSGNAESLADALVRLKDSAEAGRMGRSAYDALWADPPTMEKHLSKLLNIYQEVLAQ